MTPDYADPALREACRGQLLRELLLRLVLHDLRNSMTAVTGWFELLRMDGVDLPGGLERGIDSMGLIVKRYDSVQLVPPMLAAPLGALLSSQLGIDVEGGEIALPLDPLRFLSAVELAAPSRVLFETFQRPPTGLRVQLSGLSDEALDMSISPHPPSLIARVHRPDAVLGAVLLRVVARDARGELRRGGPGTLDLLFP